MSKQFKTPFLNRPERRNFLVKVAGASLGRAASQIAIILMGKNSSRYCSFICPENYVFVNDVSGLRLTGGKELDPVFTHSLYVGGLKERLRKDIDKSQQLRMAVAKMLPKNRLRKRLLKRLKIGDLPTNIKKFEEISVA